MRERSVRHSKPEYRSLDGSCGQRHPTHSRARAGRHTDATAGGKEHGTRIFRIQMPTALLEPTGSAHTNRVASSTTLAEVLLNEQCSCAVVVVVAHGLGLGSNERSGAICGDRHGSNAPQEMHRIIRHGVQAGPVLLTITHRLTRQLAEATSHHNPSQMADYFEHTATCCVYANV